VVVNTDSLYRLVGQYLQKTTFVTIDILNMSISFMSHLKPIQLQLTQQEVAELRAEMKAAGK